MKPHLIAALLVCLVSVWGSYDTELNAAEQQQTPNYIGRTLQESQQVATLAGVSLKVGTFYISADSWREDLRPNIVYLQSPQSGESAGDFDTVVWLFRKADADRAVVTMPNLIGMTQKNAEARLKSLRLPLVTNPSPASTEGEKSEMSSQDMVVRDQYPRPDQKIYEGTSVTLRSTE